MGSVKSSVQRWKAAAARLAVVIVIGLLGLPAVWPQEPAQPRIEEETAKQQKIYQSRGADVPDGYVTNRGLSDYAGLLFSGFCDALTKLGTSDRWLDIGAGAGLAILDYYAPPDAAAPAEKCARPGGLASAVAMSIEDRRTDAWRQLAASLGERIRYVSGKALRHYSLDELGKFQIITDVYGGFSYTEDLSRFMEKVLSFAGSRRWLLHDRAVRAFRGCQGQLHHWVSDRAGGCRRPRREIVLLAEEDLLRASQLRIEERLGPAHRADQYPEGLQRRLCPAHETIEVPGGESSQPAIPTGAIGCESGLQFATGNQ